MSVLAAPAYTKMMWPVIVALKRLGGSAGVDELLSEVVEGMALPIEVQNMPHGDGRQSKVDYNMRWALTYLKKGGFVDNSARAVWSLTPKGEECSEAAISLVPANVRREMQGERRAAQTTEKPDETIAPSMTEHEPELHWKDVLLSELKAISPDAFERLSQRLLREAGFVKVEVTGRSGDGGIDGIGVLRLNLLSFQVLFQCKRYSGSVGPGMVRDFRGAMVGRSDKGLMITTGTYTADARKEATRDGAPPIELIDGDHLCDLLKSLGIGVRTEMVERVVVDNAWFQRL